MLEHGYVCTLCVSAICRFTNQDEHSMIEVNRGPTKYYRTTFFRGFYRFTLDCFGPARGLPCDIPYKNTSDLRGIFQYFLNATTEYAIPFLKRLPYPPIDISADVWQELSNNPTSRAIAWAERNELPIVYNSETLVKIQEHINEVRGDDYSKKHFYRILPELIDTASFLGEVVLKWRNDGHWTWSRTGYGVDKYQLVFSNKQPFCVIDALLLSWVFTPEFPGHTISMLCEYLRRRLR